LMCSPYLAHVLVNACEDRHILVHLLLYVACRVQRYL
jgi:hypothetical protein